MSLTSKACVTWEKYSQILLLIMLTTLYVNRYGRYFGHCPSPQATETLCFGGWICLCPQVEKGEEEHTLTGPLKRANIYLLSFLVLYDKQYLKCQLAGENNFTVKILNSSLILYYYFAGPSGRAVCSVGSNSAGDHCECCVVRWRSLRRADHASRGVLPSVVRRRV